MSFGFIHRYNTMICYSSSYTFWSFAEKTFVKQSMMLCVWNFAQNWWLGGGQIVLGDLTVNHTWWFEGRSDLAIGGGGKSYRHQIDYWPKSVHFGVCTIGPPPKLPSPIWPQIARSDLVSVWFTPPPPPKIVQAMPYGHTRKTFLPRG